MKLKKLFAGIVAVAMMATMAAPAFAFREEFQCSDTLMLTKTYAVESGSSPAVSFDFTLADDTDKANDQGATKESPLPETHSWKLDFAAATAGSAAQIQNIELDFTKFGFTQVGRYYYVISETNADAKYPGVTSDTQNVYMTVNVMNKSEDAAEGFRYYAVLRKGSNKDSAGKIDADKAFKNTYNAKDLTISKTVHGDFGDLGKTFAFKVKLDAAKDATYGTATITYNAANNGVVLPEGVTTNPQSITVGNEVTIYLKHKGTATISNLPAGVTYTVTELESDDAYRVSVDAYSTTEQVGEGKEAKGTIGEKNIVNFHNTNLAHPDTGVILDNAPYIALLTIVAAGAVVMILKKRRNYED